MQLLEALATRTRETPEAPWLFYRQGLDWHWRSYRRIADQIARSALALGADPARIPFRPDQNPDALAVLLAILASGGEIDFGATLEPQASETPPWSAPPWLLPCRGGLERFDAEPLPEVGAPTGNEMRRFTLHLSRDIAHLSGLLSRPLSGLESRPILFAGAAAAGSDTAGPDRAWTGPLGRLAALAGWALEHYATWALEPLAEAFAATALWTRPHVVVATESELEALESHFGKSAKRHSRLKAIVVVGASPGGGTDLGSLSLDGEDQRLGVPVLPWP